MPICDWVTGSCACWRLRSLPGTVAFVASVIPSAGMRAMRCLGAHQFAEGADVRLHLARRLCTSRTPWAYDRGIGSSEPAVPCTSAMRDPGLLSDRRGVTRFGCQPRLPGFYWGGGNIIFSRLLRFGIQCRIRSTSSCVGSSFDTLRYWCQYGEVQRRYHACSSTRAQEHARYPCWPTSSSKSKRAVLTGRDLVVCPPSVVLQALRVAV
jgi:hypothetical protein